MGRKSIEKERKPLSKKAKIWVRELVPILQEQDLQKLTLDELAALIGKSKSTIYTYFSTKEEIYKAVILSVLEDINYVITSDAVEGENAEDLYRRLLLKLSDGIRGLSIHFMAQIQNYFPSLWVLIEDFSAQTISNFEIIYKKGMANGEFKTFNIALLTELDNHLVMSMMTNTQRFHDSGISLNHLVTEYLDLRLSALKKA